MEETVNARINSLIDMLKITPNAFASRLGVKTTVIYNVLKGRNKPSFDLLTKILDSFQLPADWLVSGKGKLDEHYIKSYNENYIKNGNSDVNLIFNNDGDDSSKSVGDNGQTRVKTPIGERATDSQKKTQEKKHDSAAWQAYREASESDENREALEKMSSERINKLFALKATYANRFRLELKAKDEKLFALLELTEYFDYIVQSLYEINILRVNNRPDLFSIFKYKTDLNIENAIDYQDYKANLMEWLIKLEAYRTPIEVLNTAGAKFTQSVEQLAKNDTLNEVPDQKKQNTD